MPLTCGCDFESDEGPFCSHGNDYSTYPEKKRGQRCASCRSRLIHSGDIGLRFHISRPPKNDVEYAIHGDSYDAVNLADKWFCEDCADLFFSLEEIGYCVTAWDCMPELICDYKAIVSEQSQHSP